MSAAEVMDEASCALTQFHVGEDVVEVVDIGMSLEVGEMVSFPPRVVSHWLW